MEIRQLFLENCFAQLFWEIVSKFWNCFGNCLKLFWLPPGHRAAVLWGLKIVLAGALPTNSAWSNTPFGPHGRRRPLDGTSLCCLRGCRDPPRMQAGRVAGLAWGWGGWLGGGWKIIVEHKRARCRLTAINCSGPAKPPACLSSDVDAMPPRFSLRGRRLLDRSVDG